MNEVVLFLAKCVESTAVSSTTVSVLEKKKVKVDTLLIILIKKKKWLGDIFSGNFQQFSPLLFYEKFVILLQSALETTKTYPSREMGEGMNDKNFSSEIHMNKPRKKFNKRLFSCFRMITIWYSAIELVELIAQFLVSIGKNRKNFSCRFRYSTISRKEIFIYLYRNHCRQNQSNEWFLTVKQKELTNSQLEKLGDLPRCFFPTKLNKKIFLFQLGFFLIDLNDWCFTCFQVWN